MDLGLEDKMHPVEAVLPTAWYYPSIALPHNPFSCSACRLAAHCGLEWLDSLCGLADAAQNMKKRP